MFSNVDYEQGPNWSNMREFRINQVVKELKRKGMKAVVLSKLDTIRYVTSYRGVYTWQFHGNRHIAIVTDEGHISFLVASGCYDRVKNTMPWLDDVVAFPFVMSEGYPIVEKKLKELGIEEGKVGIDMMPYSMIKLMQEGFPKIEFVDGLSIIENAQLDKCDEEIYNLKKAAQMVDIAMTQILDNARVGISEIELSAMAAQTMMNLGSEDIPYYPLVVSGSNSWLGYRFPTKKKLENGDMLWIDCGACLVNGYNGDIARTTVIGEASEEQKKIYRCMYDMLHYAQEELKIGNSINKPLEAAENAAAKHGMSQHTYFGILGHGIGTDLHIAPTIGDKVLDNISREVEVFSENMVLALEPGLSIAGVGGGHVENMILVTKDGPEILTKTRFEKQLLKF